MADFLNAQIKASYITGNSGARDSVRLEITNWNDILRALKDAPEDWLKDLRKDFRRIAKGPQTAVRKAIPSRAKPPLTNMRQVHFGRLAWGTTYGGGGARPKPAKSVLVQLPGRKAKYRQNKEYPIVRLQVGSPATVLTDMAGSVGGVKGRRGLTPEYDYMYTINGQKVPGKRRHFVTPGAFIRALNKSGKGMVRHKASRMVWPAVEKSMPLAVAQMDYTITNVNRKLNERDRKSTRLNSSHTAQLPKSRMPSSA